MKNNLYTSKEKFCENYLQQKVLRIFFSTINLQKVDFRLSTTVFNLIQEMSPYL